MAIAIYFNSYELGVIASILTTVANDGAQNPTTRRTAQSYLDLGFSTYQSAPIESGPRAAGDVDCRRLYLNTRDTVANIKAFLLRWPYFESDPNLNGRYPDCLLNDPVGWEQL